MIVGINDALKAIAYALLVLFFVIGVMKTCGSFTVLVHYNTELDSLSGHIIIAGSPRPLSIKYGFTGSFGMGGANYLSISGDLYFTGKASFARGSKLICGSRATMCFGNNFSSNTNCIINAGNKVVFGDNCLLSWNISILDGDGHELLDLSHSNNCKHESSIIIGNHVWICMNSMILKGTSVMDDSIIGAGSITSKKFDEPNLMIAGINEVIKKQINWIK